MSVPPFRARVTFTRTRLAGGSYSAGRYTPGTGVNTSLIGSIQPPTASQGYDFVMMLPEAERTKKAIVVYCAFYSLRVANESNNQEADLVTFRGEVFKVMRVNTWAGNILSHDQVYCVRLDND